MIGMINNWVSKVVGTVKAPLSAIAPEISAKSAPKSKSAPKKARKPSKKRK